MHASIHKPFIPSCLLISFQEWQDKEGSWLTKWEPVNEQMNLEKQNTKQESSLTVWWAHAHQWDYVVLNDSYGYDNNYKS